MNKLEKQNRSNILQILSIASCVDPSTIYRLSKGLKKVE